jgi:hypothetical protein
VSFLDDYQPVEDRLREFWLRHPSGRITTTLLFHEDQHYIVQAQIYRGDELRDTPPVATGLAHDSYDQLPNNMRQSALEVCETSAIGRALANMGFAPKGRRPSREEMHKASGGGQSPEPAAPLPNPGAAGTSSDGGGDRHESVGKAGVTPSPSSDPLADLLEAVGGSETKAINAVNKAVGGGYRKADLETLTPDEWAAGLAAVVMS